MKLCRARRPKQPRITLGGSCSQPAYKAADPPGSSIPPPGEFYTAVIHHWMYRGKLTMRQFSGFATPERPISATSIC